MLNAQLPLGLKLDEAFGWMAAIAQSLPIERRNQAMGMFAKLVHSLGETEVTVTVPCDHILCQTCDELRKLGKHEEVQVVEELIQVLKGGESRLISGGFQLNARNLADLDGQLETLRKVIIAGQ